jgi:hypothetical protein
MSASVFPLARARAVNIGILAAYLAGSLMTPSYVASASDTRFPD